MTHTSKPHVLNGPLSTTYELETNLMSRNPLFGSLAAPPNVQDTFYHSECHYLSLRTPYFAREGPQYLPLSYFATLDDWK
jgi:hypothetical protein